MPWRIRGPLTAIALLAVTLLALPVASKKRPPPACPAGRYLVQDGVVGGERVAAVVVGASEIAIDPVCAAAAAHLKGTKAGIKIRASWNACTGFAGRVHLTAHIAPGCTTMTGKLRARKFTGRLTARLSTCGDAVFDP